MSSAENRGRRTDDGRPLVAVVDYDVAGDGARLPSFGVWVIDSWLCEQFAPDTW